MKPRRKYLARSAGIGSGTRKPVKARNPKRRKEEFARTYHSGDRVEFVKTLTCAACFSVVVPVASYYGLQTHASENAHTGRRHGMGRKSHYTTIVPLCPLHHRAYDEHRAPFDKPKARAQIEAFAPRVEAAWLAYLNRTTA